MQDETSYGVSFVSLPGMEAIEVIDPIERHRYRLETPNDVTPETIDPDQFLFPVDRAVSVETRQFTLPSVVGVYVRTDHGEMVAEIEYDAEVSLDEDNYVIELCTPVKLYLEFTGSIEIVSDQDSMSLVFDTSARISLGARSVHNHPETCVTTTSDPSDMMAAVSTFGSALKTSSPERSFPSLRGHPPRIELDDSLSIPEGLSRDDSRISIGIKPEISNIFSAASIAYYLDAQLVPNEWNELLIDGEVIRDLGTDDNYQESLQRILKQTFLLDCVTRTEGLYPVTLDERRRLETRVGVDFAQLYDLSNAERLRRYLSIPYDVVEDLVPRWGVTAHMEPDPGHVSLLPYLADDLGFVNVHEPSAVERPESPTQVVDPSPSQAEAFTRSSSSASTSNMGFVRPPTTDSVDQLWVGEGTPIGASKAIPEAFEHRLEREPQDSDIDITVICNDSRMIEEQNLLNDIYGFRDDVSFDVTIHQNLKTGSLRDVLTEQTDFLHYIGHIDDQGFECSDGRLDLQIVDEVGVSSFLLNACQSYKQGRHLIEHGGVGGIVTLSDVINESAVRMGETLSRLLNLGFPLYAALRIAKKDSLMGGRYIVIGDGRVSLTQPQSIPQLYDIDTRGLFDFSYTTFPTKHVDMGSLTRPFIEGEHRYYLISNTVDSINPSKEDVLDFLEMENAPVYIDGDLTWSENVEAF